MSRPAPPAPQVRIAGACTPAQHRFLMAVLDAALLRPDGEAIPLETATLHALAGIDPQRADAPAALAAFVRATIRLQAEVALPAPAAPLRFPLVQSCRVEPPGLRLRLDASLVGLARRQPVLRGLLDAALAEASAAG